MKRLNYIAAIFVTALIVFVSSCDNKRKPGKIYMPDMAYSRAYETYASHDSTIITMDPLKKGGNAIYYNNSPVPGTMKRGELFPYTLPNDSNGYKMSALVKNPLDSISSTELKEAGRLYNINCAICHGDKGIANGPLAASGQIGGVANLTQPAFVTMTDGTMFHSIHYGKANMGSYASQLSRKQRWMIIKYIRTLQPKSAATPVAKADSTIVKKG